MEEKASPNCAFCPYPWSDRLCRHEKGRSPENCPTKIGRDLAQKAHALLKNSKWQEFARQSSIQEGEGYGNKERGYRFVRPIKPRIQEIHEFAYKMGYKKLGLVFCVGLRKEAKVVAKLFNLHGFDVFSVVCKVGCLPKEELGLTDDQKIEPGTFEPACNPVLQALILNEKETEFNVVMGLCVGHDSLFFKFSEAPCTVLAVKDRVLVHNPLAAIYNLESYYRALKSTG